MWNVLNSHGEDGKRYELLDLGALLVGLGYLLDVTRDSPMRDCVIEDRLQSFERDEFVFALAELFRALLTDASIPPEGHPGYQQALISELLDQTHGMIEGELMEPEFDADSRAAVWASVERLLLNSPEFGDGSDGIFLMLRQVQADSDEPYRSHRLSPSLWAELLAEESGLRSVFIPDDDWRYDQLMDVAGDQAESLAGLLGINLESTYGLPPTPTAEELAAAESYLKGVMEAFDAEFREAI